MKIYSPEALRNVAIIGHGNSGKTSLTSAVLFNSGAVNRLGRVDNGTTVTDYDESEIERKVSINPALAFCQWNKCRINLIDTPGFGDFVFQTKGFLRAAESAIITVCAVAGVEVYTEKVWDFCEEFNLSRIFFINKLDRENASFERTLDDIINTFKVNIVPLQIPVGAEQNFSGIVDLISQKAFTFYDFPSGQFKETTIPEELKDLVQKYREKLIEAVAEVNDSLLEKYLEGEEISAEEIKKAIKTGITSRILYPVLCGSAYNNIGIYQLMDFIVEYLPSPFEYPEHTGTDPTDESKVIIRKTDPNEPFSAFCFASIADPYAGRLSLLKIFSGSLSADSNVYNASKKAKERVGQITLMMGKEQHPITEAVTGDICCVAKLKNTLTGDTLCDEKEPIIYPQTVYPDTLISYCVKPKSKGDEDKINNALMRMAEEDPLIKAYRDPITNEQIISGMGQLHIEVTLERMKKKFGVDTTLELPTVPYRETITTSAKAQGRYKKQTGGRGQFGDCFIEIEPLPRGKGFEFVDAIFGGAIPRQYIPAVEKGVIGAMESGLLAGFPVVDVKVTLYDGSYHPVDSSELAFKIAGSFAFKKAFQEARPILLEPIYNIVIEVPEENMGDIIGDLNSRRGRVLGMEPSGKNQLIKAQVPLAEILRYASDLRSMTGGKGYFTKSFAFYEEVPSHIAEKIIANAKKREEEKE